MKTLAFSIVTVIFFTACSPGSQRTKNTEEAGQTTPDTTYETTGSVQRIDSRIDDLIPDTAQIEILASGFSWSEGPVWVPALNAVVFTDVPENIAYQWSESNGLKEYLNPSGYTGNDDGKEGANGLILDLNGNLILCQHGDRRLARMKAPVDNPEEDYQTIVSHYEGKKFNSPNDVAQSQKGSFFFTDPPYGLKDDDTKELDFQGVYKVDTAGNLSLLIDSLSRPNGIALSPDEKTLYVAVSDPEKARYYAYDLDENDQITGGKILLDVTAMVGNNKPGLPDGLCIDNSGNLFATGPGGILVINPEGEHLGTIDTEQPTANCTFNEDKSVLYITANMHLMRIRLK